MCGIVGFMTRPGEMEERAAQRLVSTMRDRMVHRGPDDEGAWVDGEAGIAFGFRRLSIVDLSAAGHQPMLPASGRYVIMLNGEIYNAGEIRDEIEQARGPVAWRGHCDTEVLAEAVAQWGVVPAIERLNGMFGLAIWDRQERRLTLARDRMGEKPLHYGWAGNAFVFGSELKALRPHPRFEPRISAEALADFMQLGYVPGGRTIYEDAFKLPPGHLLHVDQRAVARRALPASTAYWDLRRVAVAGLEAQASGRAATAEELEALLRDAVARRMMADVPVGAFLSGGIDSSLVTALMAAESPGQVRSFSIGFDVKEWNEAPFAKGVAEHLRTRHEEQYLTQAEITAAVREIPAIADEPFADDSMTPTLLVSRMARRSVTVALSGDGGDELFAGYKRYAMVDRLLARRDAVPGPARSLAQLLVGGVARPAARRWAGRRLERRLGLLDHLLGDGSPERMHERVVAPDPSELLARPLGGRGYLSDPANGLGRSTRIDRMSFLDAAVYLPDDILTKVDRASMSTSLEVRAPLLDHRVAEMSWRFPSEAKCVGGEGKQPLRAILYKYVPRPLVDRPKQGFGAPVSVWLRRELRDWAEPLMSRGALAAHGLLNVERCRRMWEDYAERDRGWDAAIWNVLMFQAWYEAARPTARAEPVLAA